MYIDNNLGLISNLFYLLHIPIDIITGKQSKL